MAINKIGICGVCDIPHSTNTFMAKAFESIGCEVSCFNFRTRLKNYNNDIKAMNESLIGWVRDSFTPDLLIFCKCESIQPYYINIASQYCKTWYWFMDPLQTALNINAVSKAKQCTFASATSSEVEQFFKVHGCQNTYHIIEGFDPVIYNKQNIRKEYNVVFIGTADKSRFNKVRYLYNNGLRVFTFGNHWPQELYASPQNPIYNKDMAKIINQSRIVLNFPRDTNSFSDRVSITLGCGSFLLTEKSEDLMKFYKIGTDFDVWEGSMEQCKQKIHYYLAHEDEREQIAQQGNKTAHTNYTWEAQCSLIRSIANV